MRTTIDRAGRLVVPKALRDDVGLAGGGDVEVTVRDGRIEVAPATVPMRVVDRDEVAVLQADEELPKLSAEEVRATLERVRR